MNKLIFEFSRGKHLISDLIPFISRGQYSHVSIVIDYHTLLSARMLHGVGYHKRDTTQYKAQEYWCIHDTTDTALMWATSKIGCGYDYRGVLAFLHLFTLLQQEDEKFFCSEYASELVKLSGVFEKIPYDWENWKVSPVELLRQFRLLAALPNSTVEYLGHTLTKEHFV